MMRCEVCEGFRPGTKYGEGYTVREVKFDVRSVLLCGAHAKIAERSGVTTFEQLRELYGDDRQRSYVPRRGPSASYAPNKRRNPGRRATDR
jgi:hypothetical protein